MNPFPIDAVAYGNRLRSAPATEKLLFAAGAVALCVGFRSLAVTAVVVTIVTAVLRLRAGIGLRDFWGFLWLPSGFILTGVVPMAIEFLGPQTPGVLASVHIGSWHLGVTSRGLTQAMAILASSFGSLSGTLFLALTTPIVDITDQLRRWHVPVLFIDMMMLIYRFTFVLLATAGAMKTAQEVRLGYSTNRLWLRSVAMLASNLYLRSQMRAVSLFTALSCRGYSGELRVLVDRAPWSATRVLGILGVHVLVGVWGVATRTWGWV
jgi:cobalt/nickel transport system permease protein